jgi:hypothetical protein
MCFVLDLTLYGSNFIALTKITNFVILVLFYFVPNTQIQKSLTPIVPMTKITKFVIFAFAIF